MKYEAIEKAIAQKDMKALREAVGNICYTSRDFSSGEFDEAIKYAKEKGMDIKESSLTGKPTISSQKSSFTDDDFAEAVFALKENFCDERIQDVKEIGKKLYGAKNQKQEHASNKNQTGTSGQEQNEKMPAAIGAATAAIILIIIAWIAKK